MGFQSLFWWKYCPGSTGPGGEDPNPPVSILVLVEVLPWVPRSRTSSVDITCFNPCSGGSIALGKVTFDPSGSSEHVSILVLVEVLPWAKTILAK